MTSHRYILRPNRSMGFSLDPYDWIEGTVAEDYYQPDDDAGFFHVTTRVESVRRTGLRSRKQLRAENIVGLGGGFQNEAPDKISFVWDLSRSRWLADAMRVACLAAHNALSAADVIRAVFEWTDWPRDPIWSTAIDEAVDEERVTRHGEPVVLWWLNKVFGHLLMANDLPGDMMELLEPDGLDTWLARNEQALEEEKSTGQSKYKLIQYLEHSMEVGRQNFTGDLEESQECMPIVGFTADHSVFVKTNPSEIAIVQAAVRAGAPMEIVINECEIRFRARDVELVSTDVERTGPVPVDQAEAV